MKLTQETILKTRQWFAEYGQICLDDAVKAKGFHIDGESTCRELADKGLFDSVMIAKIC